MNQNSMGMGQGLRYPNYLSTGPLMTDHLQVRNLDRELEILRHKREVVQREKQMLTMKCEMDRKRQYKQTNHSVSNMYGNVWQQPPPKRANTPQQVKPWMSATHDSLGPNVSKSMPTNYIPSLLSKKIDPPIIPLALKPIVHPILKNTVAQRLLTPINVRKDFRLTQVTKKKPKDLPNKLNSYPVKERKDLVAKATGSQLVKNKANKPPVDPETMILREDQIPNKQVTGRLELALGSIVKEIRCSNCHNNIFKTLITNPTHRRTMKQAVRERIRTVMLNQSVGSVVDIVNKYRERFSKRSDRDIVELVIKSEHPNLVTVIETESPEEFFRKNITSILEKKIQEMSSNLLNMYTNVRRKPTLSYTQAANDADNKLDESVESESNDEMAMKVLRGLTGKYVTIEERNVLSKYYTELIEDLLEEKLPEYLPQCTEDFLKIFDLDRQFKTVKFMAAKRIRDEVKAKKSEARVVKDQSETNIETSDKKKPLEKETTDNNNIEEETVIEENEMEKDKDKNDTQEKSLTENTQEGVLTENIPGKEITEANKTKEITELEGPMGPEESSAPTSATPISTKMSEPSEAIKPITRMEKNTESSSTTPKTPLTVSTPLAKELPYYVKLIGRPKLPNRAVICEFLNSYRPNSIKKHKSINNLLVIGFINQQDYNKILTANETVIGDITIVIKASEKINPGKENEAIKEGNETIKGTVNKIDDGNKVKIETKDGDKAEQKVEDGNEICKETTDSNNDQNEDEEKDLIGKELDDQISDLLSTIKNADDEIKNINKEPLLVPIKEGQVEVNNIETHKTDKVDKSSKVNIKESGRATPVRSSSRLGNVTPSTIRTRRASRLMQE